jgi:hypothetical protein
MSNITEDAKYHSQILGLNAVRPDFAGLFVCVLT